MTCDTRAPVVGHAGARRHRLLLVVLAVCGSLLVGCGSGTDADGDLPPLALEGRSVMRSRGCASCHGANGTGGVGPAFVGLFGSDVPIQGSDEPVTADREYLIRSITDPAAELVDGFNLPMPRTELTEAEIDAVVAYIEALGADTP